MKIIQVPSYFSPHIGGIEAVSKEISEHLAKIGYDIEIFTSDIGCEKGKLKSTKNLKINYLKAWEFAHTPIIPSLFFKLMSIPKDFVIHLHTAQAFTPEIVYFISKIRNIPYIIHLHGEVKPTGKLGFLLKYYQKYILSSTLKSSSRIIVLNEYYRNFFENKFKTRIPLDIIPNGINKNFFVKKKMSYKRISNLLYVGRLNPEKNIDILIKAMSLIKNKVILHIVGEGEKKEEIEKLIQKINLKNIILHGRKEGNELLSIYKKADICLLASNSEGLPGFLLESMASNTPIIASDVQGTRDLIKGVGILVNPPTSENFAKEIDKLIENPKLRKKMAEKGRKKAEQYKWDKIMPKWEKLYKEVLNQHANKQ